MYTFAHQTNSIHKKDWVIFHKQYLFGLLFSENANKTHRLQSILQLFFCSVWKEITRKPLKIAASKIIFFSVYLTGKTCFDECFLFHVITGWHFLHKFLVTLKDFSTPCCCVPWNKCFETSLCFMLNTPTITS